MSKNPKPTKVKYSKFAQEAISVELLIDNPVDRNIAQFLNDRKRPKRVLSNKRSGAISIDCYKLAVFLEDKHNHVDPNSEDPNLESQKRIDREREAEKHKEFSKFYANILGLTEVSIEISNLDINNPLIIKYLDEILDIIKVIPGEKYLTFSEVVFDKNYDRPFQPSPAEIIFEEQFFNKILNNIESHTLVFCRKGFAPTIFPKKIMELLAVFLKTHKTLISFELNMEKLTDFPDFQDDPNNQQATDVPAQILFKALKLNPNLTTLTLFRTKMNYIAQESFLDDFLKQNNILKTLNLTGCRFELDHFKSLCNELKVNKTLTKLDLFDLTIPAENFNDLTDALYYNNTLQMINLSFLRFSEGQQKRYQEDSDFVRFFEAIKKNTSITMIDFSENRFLEKFYFEFAQALKINTTLTKLDLSLCPEYTECGEFTEETKKAFAEAVYYRDLKRPENKLSILGVKLPVLNEEEKKAIQERVEQENNEQAKIESAPARDIVGRTAAAASVAGLQKESEAKRFRT